jgi:hypothetical protein
MTKILRGFTIRVHRSGDPAYVAEKQDTYAEKGTIPNEWEQVKQDPTVDHAQLYRAAQRRVRADKRHYVDQYSVEE